MTREAFESWDREVFGLPDRYYTPLYDGDFPSIDVKARWMAWQAATDAALASAPAWHNAPTCAGLWVADYGVPEVARINQPDVDNFDPLANVGGRWYGPLPPDSGKQS